MANVASLGTFYPRRVSQYVAGMQYASDVNMGAATRISFGAPGAANATYYLSALSAAAALVTQASGMLNSATADSPYGRNVQVVLSGAGTGTITIDGYDYLMQPMSETMALNGATPVLGLKAFYLIRQLTVPTVGAVTLNLGTGAKLGVPYKVHKVLSEELDGAVVGTLGTIVTPTLTSPATATTGEPRGIFTPQSTLTGSAVLTATLMFMNDVNSSNVGGLHGVPHFAN
jgi:hypothetical protein